ncbi:hypothetical protein [Phyllobacterium leguminum]|uniref:Uncharacterized protein n=1 Tax=Phyllobacterium leguminum TaxID=314237 RepID=A0A318SXY7_9HYPH|nr:hypothetical protein [Phyllobacterium leguminum]PYE85269.1 hypothetical protein C7477_13314 [Phyllobacterium leguminum]
MKTSFATLAVAMTLTACGVKEHLGPRRWAEVGMTHAEIREKDANQCEIKGVKRNSPDFDNCVKSEYQKRVDEVGKPPACMGPIGKQQCW